MKGFTFLASLALISYSVAMPADDTSVAANSVLPDEEAVETIPENDSKETQEDKQVGFLDQIVCGGVKCPEGSTGCSMSSSQVNDEKKCSIKCFDKKGDVTLEKSDPEDCAEAEQNMQKHAEEMNSFFDNFFSNFPKFW